MGEMNNAPCEACGKAINKARPHARYCSPNCRLVAWRRRRLRAREKARVRAEVEGAKKEAASARREYPYRFVREDNGGCRVYYNYRAGRLLRCFQKDGDEFVFYTCSRDGEPDSPIPSWDLGDFEPPEQETAIGRELFEWLYPKADKA